MPNKPKCLRIVTLVPINGFGHRMCHEIISTNLISISGEFNITIQMMVFKNHNRRIDLQTITNAVVEVRLPIRNNQGIHFNQLPLQPYPAAHLGAPNFIPRPLIPAVRHHIFVPAQNPHQIQQQYGWNAAHNAVSPPQIQDPEDLFDLYHYQDDLNVGLKTCCKYT